MDHKLPYNKIILRDKGLFQGKNFSISNDSIKWIQVYSLSITEHGQLYSSDETNNHYLLLQSLQSCLIQIIPNLNSSNQQQLNQSRPSISNKRSFIKKNGNSTSENNEEEPPSIFIKTFENDKLYIKINSKLKFDNLISNLLVWQNLKPQGLSKKWYSENKVINKTNSPHELLVCRFKVYGPLPNKFKNVNVIQGPKAPIYQPKIDDFTTLTESPPQSNDNNINEGWFFTMGALNSNGILNFISELDGTLLYSIDIKNLLTSEIREVHNSIFNSSNVLFIGQLKELRYNNIIRTTTTLNADQLLTQFLTRDGKIIPNNQRILIEFPLHIDLEDWFVGLNYFAKREYIGSFNEESKLLNDVEKPQLSDFHKANFRVSKKVIIDIIEAKFDQITTKRNNTGKIYAEVRMWGYPWSRTATVNHTNNPFWKEEFSTDLPISTQMIHILIKKCNNNDSIYSSNDKLIGTVYVTPDILTKQIKTSSTIMTSNESNGIQVNSIPMQKSTSHNSSLDIVRLTIYDPNNIPIGKLLLQVNLKEYHILSPQYFKPLEKMFTNAPLKDLIKFCNENVPTSDFERISIILLDIFQSLGVEDDWFKCLMESELVNIDIITRKNYHKRNSIENGSNNINGATASQNNVFNTLFRGSSIFSKSLEKYNIRIGQEYLEKVFGDFFAKINKEKKNCEIDPRYVKLQERAKRKGIDIDDDLDDIESSDEEYDSDLEKSKNESIKLMVEENFQNLYEYIEEIWNKIYITSNDIPQQIKTQLKNFRTKVELVCEPDDKITSLNCISAFIFLRFFCPAILNPKLFYLAKNHQTGSTQRTLTLIAKILLNLANRQEFSPHKEPHLVKMNIFLRKHQQEVLDYFDKITGRKNDFNEKILDLSHEVKRFDLGLNQTSNELPTTPYLIDKYLRLTEIVYLLDYSKFTKNGNGNQSQITPLTSPSKILENSIDNLNELDSIKLEELQIQELEKNKNVYQIGSLEFEKSEFLDLVGDNETEGFIKSLCKGNEEIFSFINSNITLKDIQKQSTKIMNRINELEIYLDNYEFPINYLGNDNFKNGNELNNNNNKLWSSFTQDILSKSWLDCSRNCLISSDLNLNYQHTNMKFLKLEENAISSLKLKFNNNNDYQDSNQQNSNQPQQQLQLKSNPSISSFNDSSSLSNTTSSSIKSSVQKWFKIKNK
ncbi:BUD2 [Candida pseudojiufengensis]|uniref:BUD2 n=1 Tax=Candida pseudojiufengensis TaxID=497109 RepID=UPI002225B03A|nr:BUD2 [Candida pseudojiufengensis]KAI5964074.1 BUD2 [Candida pseudojiufengensis]